jgi:hypothetical protein
MIFDEVILDDLDDELTTTVPTMSQVICTRQIKSKLLPITQAKT